jgi:hypothetical protein
MRGVEKVNGMKLRGSKLMNPTIAIISEGLLEHGIFRIPYRHYGPKHVNSK